MIDYKEEILNRAKELAKNATVHPYTADLLVFICMTKHLETLYLEKGLSMQIYRGSVLDLKWKLEMKGRIFGGFSARTK